MVAEVLNTALQPRNLRRLVQFLVSENNVAISLRINPIIATVLLLGPSSGSEQITSTSLAMKRYDSHFREVKQFKGLAGLLLGSGSGS